MRPDHKKDLTGRKSRGRGIGRILGGIFLLVLIFITIPALRSADPGVSSGLQSRENLSRPSDDPHVPAPNKTEARSLPAAHEPETEEEEEDMKTNPEHPAAFLIEANGQTMTADFNDNASAAAFRELLKQGPLTIAMEDYGHFEKVGDLPQRLVTCDETITTQPGDVILYLGSRITVYYAPNTWDFTKLGKIRNADTVDWKAWLGEGDVQVTFFLESQ